MNKNKLLKVINPILFVVLILQITTVILMLLEINFIKSLQVFVIHKYNGITLIILVLSHISLNWGWIKSSYFSKKAI